MYEIDNTEQCFEFLKLFYEDGNVPKFNQLKLVEIGEELLDKKGSEETVLMENYSRQPGPIQLNYSKYYAIIHKPMHGEFPISFEYERTVIIESGRQLSKTDSPTLREQLSQQPINESDLLFIILDERRKDKQKNSNTLRMLTIYFAERYKNHPIYDECLYAINFQFNLLEKHILELKKLKIAFENKQ